MPEHNIQQNRYDYTREQQQLITRPAKIGWAIFQAELWAYSGPQVIQVLKNLGDVSGQQTLSSSINPTEHEFGFTHAWFSESVVKHTPKRCSRKPVGAPFAACIPLIPVPAGSPCDMTLCERRTEPNKRLPETEIPGRPHS